MRIKVVIAAALSTLLAAPALAQEDSNCAPFDVAAAFHANKLNETRVAQGIIEGHMVMIFASPEGASWSLVIVNHEGVACLKARGTDWQTRSDPAPVQEQGS
jgi:hypothetical protein